MKSLTKAQAKKLFMKTSYKWIIKTYGVHDRVAIREGWHNFTDGLCKDGMITAYQYETWTCPFD